VVFTARQKWVDCLLASMPKSVRLLLTADAGRLAVAAEIKYGPNMSGTPYRDDEGGFQVLRRRRSIYQARRGSRNVETQNYATISGFETLVTFET
jgi:hypothetical protein